MTRVSVEFQTPDHVTLRGWFYSSEITSGPLPCIVMSPGFAGIKEMGIYKFAEFYVSQLPITCLVYDNRGFGDSDTPAGQPKGEIVPMMQCSDISDAITFVSTKEEVDPERIGVWGSSYSGGHALYVGAVDRRVKVVIGQVPCTSGWDTFDRMSSPDALKALGAAFSQDRLGRARGGSPVTISVVESDASKPSALPTTDSYEYLSQWLDHPRWENKVTLKSLELCRGYEPRQLIEKISPTPLLMILASEDRVTPADLALDAYARAKEPKEVSLFSCGHFELYRSPIFEQSAIVQVEFLKKWIA